MFIEAGVENPNVWKALDKTDWMWEDHDKWEVIITPRYLNGSTCSNWEPFKKKREREVEKEGDLCEMTDIDNATLTKSAFTYVNRI